MSSPRSVCGSMILGCVMALAACSAGLAQEVIEVSNSEALKAAVRRAKPGTRITMAPGRYAGQVKLTDVHGAPDALIEIAATDPKNPPVFQGGSVGFQLIKSSYFLVDGIICQGASTNNVQMDFSDHFILKNVHSRTIAGGGNCDGFKMPGDTDFLLYDCTVESWGKEGSAIDMVGCARGLIMKTRFAYPNFRGQTGNGIQPKGGTNAMGFYRNRFEDASTRGLQFGGSTGHIYFFQKNLDKGFEGYDMAAMGNVFTSGEAAMAFVSCTNCVAEYNTIVQPRKYVMRILKEGIGATGNNTFAHNLIVWNNQPELINISGGTSPKSFTFAANYWYNAAKPDQSVPKLPAPEKDAAGGKDPKLDKDFCPALDEAKNYGAHAPGLDDAWAKHTDKFKWAWEQAQKLEKK